MMNPVLNVQPLNQRSTAVTDQALVERLSAMYLSLSREVNSCKRILEELVSHQIDPPKKTYLNKVLVKCNKRLVVLNAGTIYWIEAWGDYIRLHCSDKTHVVRQKICDIEELLDPGQFLRINRSAIVNIEYVKELEPMNHGDYLVTLVNSTQLNMSRNYRERLDACFSRQS
jgi:DNA-binding LytR/AlgR family response regulator